MVDEKREDGGWKEERRWRMKRRGKMVDEKREDGG